MKPIIRIVLFLAVAGLAALGYASTATAAPKPLPAPVFHASNCEHRSTGSVDIPAVHGARYTLDGVRESAGTYTLATGSHTVTARKGRQSAHWSFTVTVRSIIGCAVVPTVPRPIIHWASPTFVAADWNQATCGQPEGSVDIPADTGVIYDLDTIPSPAGNALLGVGSHQLHAAPADGYRFPAFTVTSWSFTVVAPHC